MAISGARRLVLLLVLSLFALPAVAQTFTVTRTSHDTLYADTAHIDAHLCGYVAYRIEASAPVADLWATIGDFAGGRLTLSPLDDGVYHVGAVSSPGYRMAFFYVCGDTVPAIGEIVTGQTHVLRLWDRDPSLPGALVVNTTNHTLDYAHAHINANANKIDAITVTPANPVLGGTFTLRVDGRTGTVGSDEHLVFTPAAHADWPAGAFELVSTYIDLPDVPGDPHVIVDDLVHTGLAVNSANTPYFALYTFRVNAVTTAAAETSPYSYIDSGTNLKHTDVSHVVYPVIPPTPSPATIGKTADPSLVTRGTATTVTFTVRFNNNSDQPITLDQLRDTMPAGFSYVPGSSTYGGAAVGDPFVTERDLGNPLPEQNLAWIGTFAVPALSSRDFTFQAALPADIAAGNYDNCAIAFVNGTQVDTTASTTDNAPACARVVVVEQPPPGGALVVQKSAIGGGQSFDFTASPAPLAAFSLDATGGSAATTFSALPAGTYTVQETVPAGWTLTGIACTVTTAGSTATTFEYTGAPGGTAAFEPGDSAAVVTLGTDAQARCTFTDTRLGALTAVKSATPGSTGQAFDFSGTGTGVAASFTLTPPATPSQAFTDLGAGTYSITETVPAGWTLAGIECSIVSAGANASTFAYTGGAGTDAFDPGDTVATVTLAAGDVVACTFFDVQSGSIAVTKNTVGGDGAFGFDTNGAAGAEFTITTVGGTGTNTTAFASVPPGDYSIAEIVPAGWTLAGIACTSSGGSAFTYTGSTTTGAGPESFDVGDTAANVSLAAGDAVTCSFTDDRQATVTVRKLVVPASGTDVVFDLSAAVNGGAAQLVGDDVPNQGSGSIGVPAGASVVASEASSDGGPISGYTASWSCTGTAAGTVSGAGAQTSAFVAPSGGNVECTFTNTAVQQNGSIALVKQASGGNGSFGFDTNATPASAEVTITTVGGTGNATAFASTAPGVYSVTELVPAGWNLTGLSCTSAGGSTFVYTGTTAPGASDQFEPGDTTATIVLAANDAVTCTYANTAVVLAGSIALVKQASGGDGSFGFDTNATPTSAETTVTTAGGIGSGVAFASTPPGTYSITELVPVGWRLTGISCAGAGSTFSYIGSVGGTGAFEPGDTTATIVLGAGSAVTCTYANAAEVPLPVQVPTLSRTALAIAAALLVLMGWLAVRGSAITGAPRRRRPG